MASWPPAFGSAHFSLWQVLISWLPSSLGMMMREQHLLWQHREGHPLGAGSGRTPCAASCGKLLSDTASSGRLGPRAGTQLPPSLLASVCLGIPWGSLSIQPRPPAASWWQAKQGEAAQGRQSVLFCSASPLRAACGMSQGTSRGWEFSPQPPCMDRTGASDIPFLHEPPPAASPALGLRRS